MKRLGKVIILTIIIVLSVDFVGADYHAELTKQYNIYERMIKEHRAKGKTFVGYGGIRG